MLNAVTSISSIQLGKDEMVLDLTRKQSTKNITYECP